MFKVIYVLLLCQYISLIFGNNEKRDVLKTAPTSNAKRKDIEEALKDDNVDVERDTMESVHIMTIVRLYTGLKPLLFHKKLHRQAEQWAVYLASTLSDQQNVLHSDQKVIYDKDKYVELLYYADDIEQAPGFNMATVSWLNALNHNITDPDTALHTKAISGNMSKFLQLNDSAEFGVGISYNRKKKAGFVVALFHGGLLDAKVQFRRVPESWEFQMPGFRNPMENAITFETNLEHMVCYSRHRLCDEWGKGGDCQVPAFRNYMHYNCYRTCTGCSRNNEPIDGGWSYWSQVTSCINGMKIKYRFCTLPPILSGGKYCIGERKREINC